MNCDYFLDAVLPADEELCTRVWAEIFREEDAPAVQTKNCVRCGKPLIPNSNRQQYCAACGEEAKKENRRERQRKKYWEDKAP